MLFGPNLDPYADMGKCADMRLAGFARNVQWINAETVLIVPTAPALGPIYIYGTEHIRFGKVVRLRKETPVQYRGTLGTLETPQTYQIIEYLPDDVKTNTLLVP